MNKITVVIPTLYKSPKTLLAFLEECEKSSLVEEVFVFDNTLGDFHTTLPKVKVYNSENLYVNPAWNRGIELCKTPYFLLINDDVICKKEVLDACVSILDDNKSIGLVTCTTEPITKESVDFYLNIEQPNVEAEFDVKSSNSEFYLGWFIIGKKEYWKPIPSELKYFFGDNWIFYQYQKQNKKVALITNYYIYHVTSTTCNALNKYSDGTLQKEEIIYRNYIENKTTHQHKSEKKISLCMIVKNEENNIARCLESVKGIVDEIIIVDTGSTDKTKEIVSKYTSNIYDYEWKDDFADARNAALEKATGDWILVLDADEVIEKGTRKDFENLMNAPIELGYQLAINSTNERGDDTLSHMIRFFPSKKYLRFSGKIHEWLEDTRKNTKPFKTSICHTIQIRHYGYGIHTDKKIQRNEKLLHKVKDSNALHANFYLASTYAGSKNYTRALECIKKWEIEALSRNDVDLSLGYAIYLDCMFNLDRVEEGIKHVSPYILRCWHNPMFCFNLAICYEKIDEFKKAIDVAKRALNADLRNVLTLDTKQSISNASALIGNCHFKLGEYNEALEYWDKAYTHSPSIDTLQCLIDLSYQLRDIEKIEHYLQEMKTNFPYHKNINNEVIYANLLFNKGDIETSLDLFMKLPNGKEYIERIISGLVSMERFDDIQKIQEYMKKYETLENAS